MITYPCKPTNNEYTVPDGTLTKENSAFSCCFLHKLTFNDDLQSTNGSLFGQCYIEIINLGKGLTELGDSLFYDNQTTDHLTVPENIAAIENFAFGYNLNYIYFPNKNVVFNTTFALIDLFLLAKQVWNDSTTFSATVRYDTFQPVHLPHIP